MVSGVLSLSNSQWGPLSFKDYAALDLRDPRTGGPMSPQQLRDLAAYRTLPGATLTPVLDADGQFTGRFEWVKPNPDLISVSVGRTIDAAMNNPGQLALGVLKGTANAVPELAVTIFKGYVYLGAAGVDAATPDWAFSSNSFVNEAIDVFDPITGRLLNYDSDAQRVGGVIGDLVGPALIARVMIGGKEVVLMARSEADLRDMVRVATLEAPRANTAHDLALALDARFPGHVGTTYGAAQTRINLANFNGGKHPTILNSNGKPVDAGWEHVLTDHVNGTHGRNNSIFTIPEIELKNLLKSDLVVYQPIRVVLIGNEVTYVRVVDTGRVVGLTTLKDGGLPTTWLRIQTDQRGNIITTYPVPAPKR